MQDSAELAGWYRIVQTSAKLCKLVQVDAS